MNKIMPPIKVPPRIRTGTILDVVICLIQVTTLFWEWRVRKGERQKSHRRRKRNAEAPKQKNLTEKDLGCS